MRQFTEHDLEIAARLLEISPLYLPIFERVEAGNGLRLVWPRP